MREGYWVRRFDGDLDWIPEKTPFNKDVHFSSASEEWETPQHIFDSLNEEFHFTLDPCATHKNAKCEKYYTKEDDGLAQSWAGERVFMNPPYGREIEKWIRKAWRSSLESNTIVVCLLPARTDTRWFHRYCAEGMIWFIQGRLKFGENENSAPFPSMIVIFPKDYDGRLPPIRRNEND